MAGLNPSSKEKRLSTQAAPVQKNRIARVSDKETEKIGRAPLRLPLLVASMIAMMKGLEGKKLGKSW